MSPLPLLLLPTLALPRDPAFSTCHLSRAMTECDSPQIPGIFGEAALILNSEEDEMKKMTALALVIEVRRCQGVRGAAASWILPPTPQKP